MSRRRWRDIERRPWWSQLITAFVTCEARRLGWEIERVCVAQTGSVYVDIRQGNHRATIRVSDHRPSRRQWRRRSMFSVRRGGLGRLDSLERFLYSRMIG